jgi:hypothetical protein
MLLRCVVACQGWNGPSLYFVKVSCTEAQYENGKHYQAAEEHAKEMDYDGPMVTFDDHDGPQALFDLFEWDTATLVQI